MSAADYQKLGDYLDTSEQPFEFGLLVCMCTGIRVGELCGLRWEDFDLANGSLAINRTVTRIENPDFFPGSTQQRTPLLVGMPKSLSSIRQISAAGPDHPESPELPPGGFQLPADGYGEMYGAPHGAAPL
ncbi:MAG: hypothetical protein ACLRT5_04030 [Lachnospiraceae bacterium]